MIKVFQASDTHFASNGDKIIHPYKAIVYKEDNGDYYCEVEAQIELLEYLKQDMILCVQTPWGWQAFRCDKPERNGNKIWVRAWHLFYDTENYVVAEENIVGESCQAALNQLKGGCDSTLPFSVVSDIADTGNFHCVRKSFAQAVNGVLEVWGGHLNRDNFTIGIKTTIGQDRGITLAYGKNIKEITAVENWDNVCTKILPVGKNEVTIDGTYLTSSTQYDIPYTKVVEFSQDIEQADGETDESYAARLKEDLLAKATEYLEIHAVPEVNYTLKAHLHDVADVGDTIWVKHPKCQVDVETHVISVKYDAIKGEYKEIEFGNFKKKLSGLNDMVTAEIKKSEKVTESFVNEELRKATDKIMGVYGNSYVTYDGDKILVVDKLPREEATNVIRINSAGIGFSDTGVEGPFNSAWTIDGTFDAQQINVINLSADAIVSGTIDSDKITVLNLEVGKNVAMGANATISWPQVTDAPTIPESLSQLENDSNFINASTATTITQNAISTATIRADQVQAGSFTMTGGSINILSGSGDSIITLNGTDGSSVDIRPEGIFVWSPTYGSYNKITNNASQLCDLSVTHSCMIPSDTYISGLGITIADIYNSSGGYGYGDSPVFGSIHSTGMVTADSYMECTYLHCNSVYLYSPGSASNVALYRSTNSGIIGIPDSSKKYKNSIEDVKEESLLPEHLYDLPVRQYKWNEGHFPEEENFDYSIIEIGFIAEEVAEVYPSAAVMVDGEPATWEARNFIAPMLALIQQQKNAIDDLIERIERMETNGQAEDSGGV